MRETCTARTGLFLRQRKFRAEFRNMPGDECDRFSADAFPISYRAAIAQQQRHALKPMCNSHSHARRTLDMDFYLPWKPLLAERPDNTPFSLALVLVLASFLLRLLLLLLPPPPSSYSASSLRYAQLFLHPLHSSRSAAFFICCFSRKVRQARQIPWPDLPASPRAAGLLLG